MNAPPCSQPDSLEQAIQLLLDRPGCNAVTVSALQAQFNGPSDELLDWIGNELQYPVWSMQELLECRPSFDLLSFIECNQNLCAIARDAHDALWLILSEPFNVDRQAWALGQAESINIALASPTTIKAWLAHCEGQLSALGALNINNDNEHNVGRPPAEEINLLQIGTDESPAIQFVNATLFDALQTGASDIHLETTLGGMTIKFRIDGVLSLQRHIGNLELAVRFISRIKVMAQLDIAEQRIPQDGRLQVTFEGRAIDVRVSIMPSIHGEDAVLRILDRQHLAKTLEGLTLANLGFNTEAIDAVRRWSLKSHGMLLVTGPTGSGKTTTLYATLAQTYNPQDKVITIEDPVEYQLPGALQIPVNERKGLTFARGLRSILRHDPDKIMVGEIRDAETAQIAVQSALTGHLVFTTVHANDVFAVVSRFAQFSIDPYTFSSAIHGIVSQRLLRRICQHCAKPIARPDEQLGLADESALADWAHTPTWLSAPGCERCRGTGYFGRFALGEVLELTPPIKSLLTSNADLLKLQAEASRAGWVSLRSLALRAAARGWTTVHEVNRVAS